MKKIILGLFITIGSTSCLFANEKKADNVVSNEKESESCQIVTHVTVLDTEGKEFESYDLGHTNEIKDLTVQKIQSFEQLKFSCTIITTVTIVDENKNFLDEIIVGSTGSGSECKNQDIYGVVRNNKTIQVISVAP